MSNRKIKVTDKVMQQLEYLGLDMTQDRVSEMVLRSAVVTHEAGTRRYGGLVFDVDSNDGDLEVFGVDVFDETSQLCPDCLNVRSHTQYDDGRVVTVPCQSCK